MTNRHNLLRNAVHEACRQASLSVPLEAGGGVGRDKALTCPTDVPVSNPSGSAYDITITSPQSFWKREFQQDQQPKQQGYVNTVLI